MNKKRNGPDVAQSRFSWRMVLPLAAFAALAGLFLFGLQTGDPSRLPSVLIGKPVPEFTLPPLEGLQANGAQIPGFSSTNMMQGKVTLINIWASWCIPCRTEHPFLEKLAKQSGAPLYGLNYKDATEAARRFLGHYGNPYTAVGVDSTGRVAIDWGVYGVPETFIVGADGKILHKQVGPIDDAILTGTLLPKIEKARRGG